MSAIKKVIKSILPSPILKAVQNYGLKKSEVQHKNPSTHQIFTKIYEDGIWGESNDPTQKFFSGSGSHDPVIVETYIKAIQKFLSSFENKPDVVDLGCGDFFVGSCVRPLCDTYVACDIVEPLINFNKEKYKKLNVDICAQHAEHRPIDFLKLDTEGTELKVLHGGDWKRFRPRIVVIEATLPCSPEPSHHEWEPFLLEQGYLFVYFDGLNRFYVREEEPQLTSHFAVPVNAFDEFVTYLAIFAEERVAELEKRLKSAMRKADEYDRARRKLIGKALLRTL